MEGTSKKKRKRVAEPVFITKTEIAQHYGLGEIATIDEWVKAGTIPPPHSQPGERYAVWLRRHWDLYVATGAWPDEAYSIAARALGSPAAH